MVKMVRDNSGRFAQRPYYTAAELDRECEHIVSAFLTARHGQFRLPVTTDELSILIEQHDASLDSSVDLSDYGQDVEGMTAFYPDRNPEVSISNRLANDARRENRLRTTLAHEFGHVHFHRHLWAEKFMTGRLFDRQSTENKVICKRDSILDAKDADWMEWQAGYVSGAILMPVGSIRRLVADFCGNRGLHAAVALASEPGQQIVNDVMVRFSVSEDAARVRLLKLGLLTTSNKQPSLFG
jgi:Zn-dependent peptidase ImmA (M78 family)